MAISSINRRCKKMEQPQTVMVQKYAEAYTELELPKMYPIPKGKSTDISVLIEDPSLWAEDMLTRIGRGTEKREEVKIEDVQEEITKQITLNRSMTNKIDVKKMYGAIEFLRYADQILGLAFNKYKTVDELEKDLKKVPYRRILSNRALVIVIFGTVNAREIIDYGRNAYKNKELNKIMNYESFVDEYTSYLAPIEFEKLPVRPIATSEDIKRLRWE
jgi:hypothetical protein